MNETPLYHITTLEAIDEARRTSTYSVDSLKTEGFIHCSYEHQVGPTSSKHFAGQTDLMVIRINPEKLTCRVVDEDLYNMNQKFPHIYGPIPIEAIDGAVELNLKEDGSFEFDQSS